MALVLNSAYRNYTKVFYVNRFLRLYPVYGLGILLAIWANLWSGLPLDGGVMRELDWPGRIFFLVSNLLIIGQDYATLACMPTVEGCVDPVRMSLNPPAWSIAIEVMFYLIAPFIVKSPMRTAMFALVGIAYFMAIELLPSFLLDYNKLLFGRNPGIAALRHYFFPASIVFFGLGATAFHVRSAIISKKPIPLYAYFVAMVGLAGFSQTTPFLPWWAAILFAASIPAIFDLTKNNSIDRVLGDLSYPVYILHFPIIIAFGGYANQSNEFGGKIAAITLFTAALALVAIDRPIDRYRHSRRISIDARPA